jgi:hypothetical protein
LTPNNKKIPGKIIIVAVLLAGVAYFCRGCGHNIGPDHSNDKRDVDSIVEKSMADSIKWGIQRDSVYKIIAFLQMGKDSLTKVITTYKVDIHRQGQDIQGLLDELDKAEADKDTASYYAGCDSLRGEFATAKGLVLHYMSANDSLASTNFHILTQKDTIIGRLSLLYTEANNSLFDVSRRYNLLYSDYKKINVKPKRWGIGPGIDVVYVNGIKIVPSIGLHYDFIKF